MSKTARRLFKQGRRGGGSSAPCSDVDSEVGGYQSDATSSLSIEDREELLISPTASTLSVPGAAAAAGLASTSLSEGSSPPEIDVEAELDAILDGLLEKRATTREGHLSKLNYLLTHRFLAEELESRMDTMQTNLLRCVKRDRSSAENVAAAKCMGLFFVTACLQEEARYAELRDALEDLIHKAGAGARRSDAVRCALLDLQAIACFVAGSAQDATQLLLKLADLVAATQRQVQGLSQASSGAAASEAKAAAQSASSGVAKVANKGNAGTNKNQLAGARVLVHALAALGLLATICPPGAVLEVADSMCAAIAKVLDPAAAVSVDARILAAENLALLAERGARSAVDEVLPNVRPMLEGNTGALAEGGDGGGAGGGGGAGFSVKGMAQRDRKAQRSAFREVLAYLDDGVAPHLKLRFRKTTVVLGTWAHLRQLYGFRQALGQGLHVHFLANPLLCDVFGIAQIIADAELSRAARKAMYSPSSEMAKARSQELAKQRTIRASKIGTFD